jgi:hypothetical protein
MGYKLLGMVVWRGARWYMHRRYPNAARNAAIAGVGAAVVIGGVVAGVKAARSGDSD